MEALEELGHLEVTCETGSVLCRIAAWDCWEFAPVLFATCISPIMHLGIVLGIVLALHEEGYLLAEILAYNKSDVCRSASHAFSFV